MSNYQNIAITDLAAIIAEQLQRHNIKVILVGGLAVEIYSENIYPTKDIDMVNISYNTPAEINQAMGEIGFTKQGRIYVNDTTEISVEFLSAPLSVGEELIEDTSVVEVDNGIIAILMVKDVIKDRLAAYFHWKDQPSLVQALAVMSPHHISPQELKRFCRSEGKEHEYAAIESLHQQVKSQNLFSMQAIETLVIEKFLQQL